MRNIPILSLALLFSMSLAGAAGAGNLVHGKALAETNCSKCHAVGQTDNSPEPKALPFREIAKNYDDVDLEDSFNEGVATSHAIMPDWQMSPEQASDLAAYVMSLVPKAQ